MTHTLYYHITSGSGSSWVSKHWDTENWLNEESKINQSLFTLFSYSSQGIYCWPPSVWVNRCSGKRMYHHLNFMDEGSVFGGFLQVITRETIVVLDFSFFLFVLLGFFCLIPTGHHTCSCSPFKNPMIWIPLHQHDHVFPSGTSW